MKICKPDYYDRFKCIAGACSDSCCIGWEIDVDEDKRAMYRSVPGELGERLKHCIDWEEGHFILQGEKERCPFLNNENLCDLIIGLGEDSLCVICREHPRYYDWYDGYTEVGVGLCCEAAARLVLESEQPAGFVTTETDEDNDGEMTESPEEKEWIEVLFEARKTAFAILQNRKKSIWSRLAEFLTYIDELQDGLEFENPDEVLESARYYRENVAGEETTDENADWEEVLPAYAELVNACRSLEPIDAVWPETLERLGELAADPERLQQAETMLREKVSDRDYEYEHLAVYFVYRYFMKCREDSDVYSKGYLAVFCVMLIRLLDLETVQSSGNLTKEDRAQNAKTCSKEIEYSEENLEILSEIFWNN